MYLNTRGIAVVMYKQWRPREKGGREGEEGEEGEREVMYTSLYKQKNSKRFN